MKKESLLLSFLIFWSQSNIVFGQRGRDDDDDDEDDRDDDDIQIIYDDFDEFESTIWYEQCSGCTYGGGGIRIAGEDQLQRLLTPISGISLITGAMRRNDYCDNHIIAVSTDPQLSWSASSISGTIKFAWVCDEKYIYGQTTSTNDDCNDYGRFTIDITFASDTVMFEDDECGSLTLSDDLASGSTLLYMYIGADNDSDDAVWRDIEIEYLTTGPTLSPVLAPTPQPSSNSTFIYDEFDFFDNKIWNKQCDGCVYSGDSLDITGSDMLQRTIDPFVGLNTISGSLVKNDVCDDHFIVISTEDDFEWSLTSTMNSIKFTWNCNNKYIYGQTNSVYDRCRRRSTFIIDIEISDSEVSFEDDNCGTLTLSDDLYSDSSHLYVYVGADNDVNTAQWNWIQLSFDHMVALPPPTMSPTTFLRPTLTPTPALMTLRDDFDEFDDSIWYEQCDGCVYLGNGTLEVGGDQEYMRTIDTFHGLSRISGGLIKNLQCDDHIIAISTDSDLSWSWTNQVNTIVFVWNCDWKAIYGQYFTTYIDCPTERYYLITITINVETVMFEDDECGTLTLSDKLDDSSGKDPYVYIGADNDSPIDEADWDYIEMKFISYTPGTPTQLPIHQPTSQPIPQPTRSPIVFGAPTLSPVVSPKVPTLVPIPQPSQPPVLPPTYKPTSQPSIGGAFYRDYFNNGFDSSFWSSQCSGCSYDFSSESLLVEGDSMFQRSSSSIHRMTRITANMYKEDVCDNHAISLASSSKFTFSLLPEIGSIKFLWTCHNKYIYGQSTTVIASCSVYGNYFIDIMLSNSGTDNTIEFIDDNCGTLSISDTISSDEEDLFVYIGADNGLYDTIAKWNDIQIWAQETNSPTSFPTILPTSKSTVSVDVELVMQAASEDDVTEDTILNSVAFILSDVDVSDIHHYSVVFTTISSSSTSTSSTSTSTSSSTNVRGLTMTVEATVSFSISVDLETSDFDSVDAFSSQVTDELTESVSDGSLNAAMSLACSSCDIEASSVNTELAQAYPSPQPTSIPTMKRSSSGGSGSSDASAASAGLIGGLVGGFMVLLIGLIYYRHRSHKQFGDGHSFDERDNGERDSADIESAYFRRGSGRSSSSYNNGHGNGNGNGQYDSRAMELMSMPSSETFNDDDIVQPSMMPPSPESNSSFRHQQSSNKTKKKPTPSSKNKKNNSTSPELKELQEFLCFGELDKFASSFLEFGITSVDDLCDMSLISDSELMSELG